MRVFVLKLRHWTKGTRSWLLVEVRMRVLAKQFELRTLRNSIIPSSNVAGCSECKSAKSTLF